MSVLESFLFRDELRTWLLADSVIPTIVGPNGVFSGRPGQTASRPYIVFNVISQTEGMLLAQADGNQDLRVQVDCWADSETIAENLKAAVRNRMHGYRGLWGARKIQFSVIAAAYDDLARPADATDDTPYRRTLDFAVATTEPTPVFV